MTETTLRKDIQIHASTLGWRLFRNNTGHGWVGTPCQACKLALRPIIFGLCVGSSDLIGWNREGQFAAVECKTSKGYTTKEQANFLKSVIHAGGIGIVARSREDLKC